MLKTLIEGFTLGLSTGTLCLVSCTPIYLPYLVSEDRSFAKNIWKVMEISLGRFFSYIVFGLMAGWLGSNIGTINRDLFTGIAYILLSIFLVMSVLRTKKKGKGCHVPKMLKVTSSAFLLGVFTGINFCPSFLIALSKAVDLAGPISGALLFMGFFLGTSIFLIPLAFSGFLAQIKKLKLVAQIASIAIAVWFIYSGATKVYDYIKESNQEYYIVEATSAEYSMVLISSQDTGANFLTLTDSLFSFKKDQFTLINDSMIEASELEEFNDNTILLIEKKLITEANHEALQKYHHFIITKDIPAENILAFLRNTKMKLKQDAHIHFSLESK